MSHAPDKRGESQRYPSGCQDGRPLWEDGSGATWCCIVPPEGVISRWAWGLRMAGYLLYGIYKEDIWWPFVMKSKFCLTILRVIGIFIRFFSNFGWVSKVRKHPWCWEIQSSSRRWWDLKIPHPWHYSSCSCLPRQSQESIGRRRYEAEKKLYVICIARAIILSQSFLEKL